jgi:hypothetical protein
MDRARMRAWEQGIRVCDVLRGLLDVRVRVIDRCLEASQLRLVNLRDSGGVVRAVVKRAVINGRGFN